MAVLVIMEFDGGTIEQYDRVDELLGGTSAENAPPGLIAHTAGVTDDGIVVADVWESPEAMQHAFETQLGPALQQAEVPQGAAPRVLPVHDHVNGSGQESAVMVILELDGMTTGDYDRLASDMDAHSGDGSRHPAVSHVAAVSDDGLVVVDIWGSEEEFMQFVQSELAPRAGDRMGGLEPQIARVHKHVMAKAPTTS